MKFKSCTVFILFVALTLSGTSAMKAQGLLSHSPLKSDFELFRRALEEAHPGLYRYSSKQEIDSIFEATENKIKHEMNQQEFYQLLLPVVGQIKCGHTKLHPDNNWSTNYFYNTEKLFPWKIYFQNSQAFITGSYNETVQVPVGSEVLVINGLPISDIIEKMLPGFFSDGNNTTFKYIEMSRYFSAYYANMFEGPDTFVVKYKDEKGATEVMLPAISQSEIERFEQEQRERTSEKPPYQLEMKSPETALITISSFWMEADHLSFKKFLKQSFETIVDNQVKHLIIDLRGNEGGKDRNGALLLSYLMDRKFDYYDRLEVTRRKKFSFSGDAHLPAFYGIIRHLISREKDGSYQWKFSKNLKTQEPKKNHFSGNVYVLIDGACFSVTAEFAAAIHYLRRATFIGEETGGAYYGNNSGTFAIVTLPHSKLNVGIPLVAYFMKVDGYPYKDRGVIPDYQISPSKQDILLGKDAVMDFTKELISGKSRRVN